MIHPRFDRPGKSFPLRRLILAAALFAAMPVHAEAPPAWPDTFVARLEALALIQTLNAEILASRSATLTLENWCRDQNLLENRRYSLTWCQVSSRLPRPSSASALRLLRKTKSNIGKSSCAAAAAFSLRPKIGMYPAG